MGAAWLSLIPQLPDFAGAALSSKMGKNASHQQRRDIRHLRRREYQDMMHSMKAAGLNPMLAMGATPGHSAVSQAHIQTSAPNAGLGDALIKAGKAPSEISANDAVAAKARAETETQESIRANIAAQQGASESQTRLNDANSALAAQHALESGSRMELQAAQAKQAGATAGQLRAREDEIRANIPNVESGLGAGPLRGGERVLEKGASSAKEWINMKDPEIREKVWDPSAPSHTPWGRWLQNKARGEK